MKNKKQTLEAIAEALIYNNNNYVLRHELLRLYVTTVNYFHREELAELKKDVFPWLIGKDWFGNF